jgi:hypothetical protein
VAPDKGYAGYTVRVAFDPTALTGLAPTCDDLRVAVRTATGWEERPRHVASCAGPGDLRFALPVDLPASSAWTDAYLYYGRSGAVPTPPPAVGRVVYLWWDPAASDRSADFIVGRLDPWAGSAFRATSAWLESDPSYAYTTGDDAQESLRRSVDERDVLVEAELRHTGCYPPNMQSGVCARVVIAAGTGADETSDHYYCSARAQSPLCDATGEGAADGAVVKTEGNLIAVAPPANPPAIAPSTWRKQALAVFGAGPTQVRFWDADAGWPALATPPASALLTTGSDAADHTMRGQAGVMLAQDIGQVRNLVIRRYVEPEPAAALGAQEPAP